jgi:hypothetical protein
MARWLVSVGVVAAVVVAAAACTQPRSEHPSETDCMRAVAHRWMLEDLEGIGVDAGLAGDGPPTADEAPAILAAAERGGRGQGAARRDLDKCTAGPAAYVDCVFAAKTGDAARACAK